MIVGSIVGRDRRAEHLDHLVDRGRPGLPVHERRVDADVVEAVTARADVLGHGPAGCILERDRPLLRDRARGGDEQAMVTRGNFLITDSVRRS